MKNRYKNSCINLMAYLHEIDPIFVKILKILRENHKLLYKIKKEKIILGGNYEDFTSKVKISDLNFLETGTGLKSNHSKKLH